MLRLLVVLSALSLIACGAAGGGGGGGFEDSGTSADVTMRLCIPGETRACACAGGTMGVQSCNGAGSGYDPCGMCPTAPRCGDGACGGAETCSTCPMDCGACMAQCGDGMCNGTETCMSCARDCGACMTAPRCGDGTCNGTETCMSCSDDCGACPARCGDGTCNGTETCSTCSMDCGTCETMCRACAQDVDCPTGQSCLQRRCDGARGCYPRNDPNAGCALIGGVRCPATAAYNLCMSNAECGEFAECSRYADGRLTCGRRCARDADCPTPPTGYPGVTPRCDTGLTRPVCFLNCTGPGTCPYGLSCFRYSNGTYGYCS